MAGRFCDYVKALKGWPRVVLTIIAGALSVLAMAPFFIWPILYLTLPVLVWLIDSAMLDARPARRAAIAGWQFGFGYFAAGLFWIGEAFLVEAETFAWMLPFVVTLLPAGLALFWAAASWVAQRFWRPGLSRVFVLAIALGIAEWLRGHVLTGFPWNVLGYALTSSDVLMQSAALVGVYALSLWAVVIFALPLVVLANRRNTKRWHRDVTRGLALSVVPLLAFAIFGIWRLAQADPPDVAGVNLRIVQPSIVQRDKWRPEKQGEIFNLHLDMSRRTAGGETDDLKGITHVIWPEAAMPFRPLDHPEALSAIKGLLGSSSYLLSGGLRISRPSDAVVLRDPHRPNAYNSLLVFGPGGGLAALYDKIHLVPFGEYLPFQSALEAIGLQQLTQMRGGFSVGSVPRRPIAVPGLPPATVLICYEAIFPGEVSAERPQLIVNVTNDGWFGNSTGPRQHFHQTRVRAVEEGVPVIRAANNGISAVIDGKGRARQTLGMNARGVIDSGLPPALDVTPFGRWGILLFLLHVALWGSVAALWRQRVQTIDYIETSTHLPTAYLMLKLRNLFEKMDLR